jgi:hypothetical protein
MTLLEVLNMKKWLICNIDKKGKISEYGDPIMTENESDNNRAYYLFGLQFGFVMYLQNDGTAINQYDKKYIAIILE